MMEIKTDALKRIVGENFGFDLPPAKLLEVTTSNDKGEGDDNSGSAIMQFDQELRSRAGHRFLNNLFNEQKNAEEMLHMADEMLQEDPGSLTKDVKADKSLINECIDGASKEYNDDLKVYWAKLVAGEIRNPGTYSKRLAQLLRSLSQKDAERIRQLSQYVLFSYNRDDAFFLRYKNNPLSFADLSYLNELQIIDSNNFVFMQMRFDDEKGGERIYYHGDIVLYVEVRKKEYDMPIYSITELGKELLRIIDEKEINMTYLKGYSESIVSSSKNTITVTGGHMQKRGEYIYILGDDFYFKYPADKNNNQGESDNKE